MTIMRSRASCSSGRILALLLFVCTDNGAVIATDGAHTARAAADYARAVRFIPFITSADAFPAGTLEEYVPNGELRFEWLGKGERFYYSRRTATGRQFVLVKANSATRQLAFDHGALARSLGAAMGAAVDSTDLPFDWLEFVEHERAVEFDSKGKRWHCTLGGACKSIEQPVPVEGLVSPDGRWSVIRKDANVWLRSLQDGTERPLTTDGISVFGYGGRDGLEQMLKRKPPEIEASWSPDSRRVLVERFDARGVLPRHYLQQVPEDGSLHSKVFTLDVGLAGERRAERPESLAIFEIATDKRVDVRHPSFFRNAGRMLRGRQRVYWNTDSHTVLVMPNEEGRKSLRLLEVDSGSGRIRSLMEESSPTYVGLFSGINRLSLLGSGEILWYSERSNWNHLYLYDRNGKLKNPVTTGEWRVQEIVRVDEPHRRVYFTAQGRERGEDPYQEHLYVVNLDGSGLCLLTPGDAHHDIDADNSFSPSGRYFIETSSRPNLAPVTVLRDRNGKEVLKLETADLSWLEAPGFIRPEPFRVLAADGETAIYGNVFRPAMLDPALRYPVVDMIYPGPPANRAAKSFMWAMRDEAQGLAELGFIVVTIDGRGTVGRSKSFQDVSYGNMQQAGNIEDHIAGIRQLAKRFPYMDLSRVGISGHSAGGYAATRALLEYPQFYKVATSTAGDQDPRQLGLGWATTFQGPFDAQSWAPLANARLAERLEGKLLLIQGDMDSTVPPAVNMQFVAALIKADKDFDLLIVPNAGHRVHYEPYAIRRRWEFFVRHLIGNELPRGWMKRPSAQPTIVGGDVVGSH